MREFLPFKVSGICKVSLPGIKDERAGGPSLGWGGGEGGAVMDGARGCNGGSL